MTGSEALSLGPTIAPDLSTKFLGLEDIRGGGRTALA